MIIRQSGVIGHWTWNMLPSGAYLNSTNRNTLAYAVYLVNKKDREWRREGERMEKKRSHRVYWQCVNIIQQPLSRSIYIFAGKSYPCDKHICQFMGFSVCKVRMILICPSIMFDSLQIENKLIFYHNFTIDRDGTSVTHTHTLVASLNQHLLTWLVKPCARNDWRISWNTQQ